MRRYLLALLFALTVLVPLAGAPAAQAALVPLANFQVATKTVEPAVPMCASEKFLGSRLTISFCRATDHFFVNDNAADGRSAGLQWRFDGRTGMCQHRAGAQDPDNYGYDRVCKDPAALPDQSGLIFEVRAGSCTFQELECREPSNWQWDTVWMRWVG